MADKPYRYDKEGKTPYILIGILLILIIIVGWGLITLISQRLAPPPVSVPNASTNVTPPPPPPTNVTPSCDDDCLLARAVSGKNYSACATISNGSIKQECYVQLSGDSLEACKLVSANSTRDSCLLAFAKAGSDLSLCDLLSQGAGQCRLAIDPCLGSADQALCRALQSSDPGRCASDTDCLLNYSMAKKDSSACAYIQSPVVGAACVSSVLNSDRCSSLSKSSERDYCYELFALYTDYIYTCTQITPDTPYAIDCYSAFAVRMGNYSVCDVFSLDERWACYRNYSLGSGDASSCFAIDPLATTNRFLCAFDFGKRYGDPSACVAVVSLSQRDTCYEGVILYPSVPLDWRKCANVTSFTWKNKCYNQAAIQNDDLTLCNYITTDYAREACVSAYNNYKQGQ